MNKIILAVFAAALLLSFSLLFAETETEEPDALALADDAEARGFVAAKENDKETAVEWFEKAGEHAEKGKDWKGTLDVGYALSTLGETLKAKGYFDKAKELTAKLKDWRAILAVGYAYASLPEEMNTADAASETMTDAKDIAEKENNWRALIEVGNGFLTLKAKQIAKQSYDKALALVDSFKDGEGYAMLADRYKAVDEPEKAAELTKLAQAYGPPVSPEPVKSTTKKEKPAPPPGWSPYGKSLAEPPRIDETSKRILGEKATQKVLDATQLAIERKRLQIEREKAKIYKYCPYYHYYFDPFEWRVWGRDIEFDVNGWAIHHLKNYRLEDDLYIRIEK